MSKIDIQINHDLHLLKSEKHLCDGSVDPQKRINATAERIANNSLVGAFGDQLDPYKRTIYGEHPHTASAILASKHT